MKPTTRGPLSQRWARFLLGLSAFSVLPPLGPRVLVAGGGDASAAVAWGYVCVASACGLRVGALLRRGAAALPAWAAAPRWAAWAAVLAAHAALGAARTRRGAACWRFAASVAAALACGGGGPDRSRGADGWRLGGRAAGAAAPLASLVARSTYRRCLRGLLVAVAPPGAPRPPKKPAFGDVLRALAAAAASAAAESARSRPGAWLAGGGALAAICWCYVAFRRMPASEPELAPALPMARAPSEGTLHRLGSPTRRRAPRLYVESCGGDRGAAEARWRKTVAWRRANDVAAVVRVGQPKYHDVKQMYPHHFGGRSRRGEIIMWELLGQLDTAVLRSGRVSMEEAFRHFIFIHEYAALKFDGEETELVTVLDVAGLRFSEVNSFLLRLVATASDVLNNLAPFRVRRIFILNAPSWFGAAWAGVRRVLPAETRHKVTIVGADYAATLADLADHDELPSTYGGGGPPLSQGEDELDMLEAVCVLNSGGAVDFLDRGSDSDASPASASPQRAASPEVGSPDAPAAPAPRPWWAPWRMPDAPRAHLGEANDFYYCDQRRRWVLRGDEEDGAAPGDGDADEDALVVAIQAATLRRSMSSEKALGSLKARTADDLMRTLPEAFSVPGHQRRAPARRGAPPPPRTRAESLELDDDGDDGREDLGDPALAFGLYLGLGLTWACQSFLFAAAPTWLLGPASRGGLGFRAADAAGAAVAACGALGLLRWRCSEALARMPERAPLRAYRVATALGVVVNVAAPTYARSLADDRLPRDSSAVHVAVALTGAAWLLGARFATDAADAAAAMMLQSHATSRAVAAAGLADAGRVAGALLATLVVPRALEAGAHAATGLYAAAGASALLYALSVAVYRRVLGDVSDDGAGGACAVFLEVPARDVQRLVDDCIESG